MFLRVLIILFCCNFTWAQVDSETLSQETLKRFELVPEFEFIIQEANKLGVKVYLFGGTASAFAHYVRWDLEREAGDDKYQAERFDYDFTNIYRGNQDLDLVVDGTPEQADQLKAILKEAYPHFVGDRDAWEVRLLREQQGDKRALIGDEDFKKQHSDTNSTGMLLLNPGPQGIIYNDLLSWGSPESDFLNDVASARIKFLFSHKHEETQRFKDGRNPPVLAAIRYLAKLAQYEVTGTTEDLALVTQIIAETDFTELSSYGKKKAEEFALKTLLNSPNSEYAWNLLDKTGARKKLLEMDGERQLEQDSLSWWMNKEPLRSSPLGDGEGSTAQELFKRKEIIVAHETNTFEAYDNITRSSRGQANAFISRNNVVGEFAAMGDGFYTRLGMEGARHTGLTIRFKLHPQAREGSDFIVSGDYVLVLNKNALTLIQENLNLSVTGFFELIALNGLSRKEKGSLHKFKRKFNRLPRSSKEFKEAIQFVKNSFNLDFILPEMAFDLDQIDHVNNFEELFNFFTKKREAFFQDLIKQYDVIGDFSKTLQLVEALVEKKFMNEYLITTILPLKNWENHPEIVKKLIEEGVHTQKIVDYILSNPRWANHDELLEMVLNKGDSDNSIAMHVLPSLEWEQKEKYVRLLIKRGNADANLAIHVFTNPYWTKYPELIEKLIENENSIQSLARSTLTHAHWVKHPYLVELLIDKLNSIDTIVTSLLSKPHWGKYPHLIEKLTKKFYIKDSYFTSFILSKEHWFKQSDWVERVVQNGRADKELAKDVLSQEFSRSSVHLLDHLIRKRNVDYYLEEHALNKDHWINHPEIREYLHGTPLTLENWRAQSLPFKEWKENKIAENQRARKCRSYLGGNEALKLLLYR